MSGVKRYEFFTGTYVEAADYDALAQRCRELEACIAGDHTNLVALLRVGQAQAERERDTLRAEVERLERITRHLVRTYIVSDDTYNPEAETDRAISRIKAQFSAT